MRWNGRHAASAAIVVGVIGLLAACGREAVSEDESSADTLQAVDGLRRELRELRADLRAMMSANEGLQTMVGQLEVELVETGPRDAYLHERSQGMDYVARRLRSREDRERVEAAVTALKQEGHAAIFGIIPYLRDADSDRRMAALYVLGEMGPAAFGALEHVRERLKDPDPAVRSSAHRALCEIVD